MSKNSKRGSGAGVGGELINELEDKMIGRNAAKFVDEHIEDQMETEGELVLDIKVPFLDNKVIQHTFDTNDTIQDTLLKLCEMYDMVFDDAENFQLLLREQPVSVRKYVIGSMDDILPNYSYQMVHGGDFVNTILNKVEELTFAVADGKTVRQEVELRSDLNANKISDPEMELVRWLEALLKNCTLDGIIGEWFATEVIIQEGTALLFDALHILSADKIRRKSTGVILGILSTLMQYEAGITWVERNFPIGKDVLDMLLGIALCNGLPDAEVYSLNTRRMTCIFLTTLLQQFKNMPPILHVILCQKPQNTEYTSYYKLLVEMGVEDQIYGMLLTVFLSMCEDPDTCDAAIMFLQKCGGSKLARKAAANAQTKKILIEDSLLSHLAIACSENERLDIGSKAHVEVDGKELRKNLLRAEERRWNVEMELKKAQLALMKMSELVNLDNQLVTQSLRAITQHGWDSLKWQKGYSCLHFAAECIDDATVVELLALLAKDPEAIDGAGRRALDYARKAGKTANIAALERVRLQQMKQQQKLKHHRKMMTSDAAKHGVPIADLDPDNFAIPEDVSPQLKAALEIIQRVGWRRVKWPGGFSALHLAAQTGRLDVVRLLLEKVDDVAIDFATKDAKGKMSPLEYAKKFEHSQIVEYLQGFDPINRCYVGEELGSGQHNLMSEAPGSTMPDSILPGMKTGGGMGLQSVWEPLTGGMESGLQSKAYGLDSKGHGLPSSSGMQLQFAVSDKGQMTAEEKLRAMHADGLMGSGGEALVQERHERKMLEARVDFLQQWINGTKAKQIGPVRSLDEDQIAHWMAQMEIVGIHKVWAKFQEPVETGGLDFTDEDAALAVEQLLFIHHKGAAEGILEDILEARERDDINPREEAFASPESAGADAGGPKAGKGGAPGKGGKDASQGKGCPPAKGVPPVKGGPPGKGGAAAGKGGDKGGKGGGKGGKGGGFEPTKPDVRPTAQMKPLWWNRLLIGGPGAEGIEEGETVWSDVKNFAPDLGLDNAISENALELQARFSRAAPKATDQNEADKDEEARKKAEKEVAQPLRVVTDPGKRAGLDGAAKKLPSPEIICAAIMDFNESFIDLELLETIKTHVTPNGETLKQMEEMRAQNPDRKWALAEQFMWEIGHLPVYNARIDVWYFLRTVGEKVAFQEEAYNQLLRIFCALEKSQGFIGLLGLILCAGNFLNGNTGRGRADGFELEDLKKFDTIKCNLDPRKKLTDFVMEQFLSKSKAFFPELAQAFVKDFAPIFTNIKRRVAKSKEGVETVARSARYSLEDFQSLTNQLNDEVTKNAQLLDTCLEFFTDPGEPMREVLLPDFEAVRERLEGLLAIRKECFDKVAIIRTKFHIRRGVTTEELFLTLDNFLIPEAVFLSRALPVRNKFLMPKLCGTTPPTLETFQILWGLLDPSDQDHARRKTEEMKANQKARTAMSKGKSSGASGAGKSSAAPGASGGASAAAQPKPSSKFVRRQRNKATGAAGGAAAKGAMPGSSSDSPEGKGVAEANHAKAEPKATPNGSTGGKLGGPTGNRLSRGLGKKGQKNSDSDSTDSSEGHINPNHTAIAKQLQASYRPDLTIKAVGPESAVTVYLSDEEFADPANANNAAKPGADEYAEVTSVYFDG